MPVEPVELAEQAVLAERVTRVVPAVPVALAARATLGGRAGPVASAEQASPEVLAGLAALVVTAAHPAAKVHLAESIAVDLPPVPIVPAVVPVGLVPPNRPLLRDRAVVAVADEAAVAAADDNPCTET